MNNYKKLESGRSMIEMLGVLAIIGVLSVGGIAGYSKAMNKFKTNKVADNVSMLVANIKTLYAQQNTYNGLTSETAVTLGVVPDELVVKTTKNNVTTTKLLNAYNGSVDIHTSDSTASDDEKAFVIAFSGLSREACITLATNDWGSGYSSGLIALRAAGKSATEATEKLKTVYIGNEGTPGRAEKEADKNGKGGNDNDVIATPGGQAGARVPLSVTSAAVACGCSAGNTCSLQWKYY